MQTYVLNLRHYPFPLVKTWVVDFAFRDQYHSSGGVATED